MQQHYDSAQYGKARRAYVAQCTLEYYISILSTDVFLSKLLKQIGCSDAFTGVLSSVVSFAFLFQLFSVPLAGRLKKVKRAVTLLDTGSQLLFASLYAVPFLPFSYKAKAAAAAGLLVAGYLTLYLNSSIAYTWGNSFVAPEHRGSFSAGKEMISLLTGVFFTLGVGFAVDAFEKNGRLLTAFLVLGGIMLLVCAANYACFSVMPELPLRTSGEKQKTGDVLLRLFANRRFLHAVALTALSEFSRFLVIGFMGTYKTEELGLSVGNVQLINVLASMGRFAVSKPFGKYSDRHSYAKGYLCGNLLTALSFVCGVFCAPAAKWLIVPCTMLYQMSFAGTNQNTFLLIYAFVESDDIMPALAVNSSIRGMSGFLASLIGGRVLASVQAAGSTVFGRTLYGQQLLHALAFVLIVLALIYNRFVVARQPEERK